LRNTLRDDHPRREKRPHGSVGAVKKTEPCGSSHYAHGLEDRCVGNQAALVIKISVRLKMQRKVYSWGRARKCTICGSVTVRSARDATKRIRVATAWLTHTAHIRRYCPSGFCPCGVHGPRNLAQNLRSASRGLMGAAGLLATGRSPNLSRVGAAEGNALFQADNFNSGRLKGSRRGALNHSCGR
jgi:hypothetical protein